MNTLPLSTQGTLFITSHFFIVMDISWPPLSPYSLSSLDDLQFSSSEELGFPSRDLSLASASALSPILSIVPPLWHSPTTDPPCHSPTLNPTRDYTYAPYLSQPYTVDVSEDPSTIEGALDVPDRFLSNDAASSLDDVFVPESWVLPSCDDPGDSSTDEAVASASTDPALPTAADVPDNFPFNDAAPSQADVAVPEGLVLPWYVQVPQCAQLALRFSCLSDFKQYLTLLADQSSRYAEGEAMHVKAGRALSARRYRKTGNVRSEELLLSDYIITHVIPKAIKEDPRKSPATMVHNLVALENAGILFRIQTYPDFLQVFSHFMHFYKDMTSYSRAQGVRYEQWEDTNWIDVYNHCEQSRPFDVEDSTLREAISVVDSEFGKFVLRSRLVSTWANVRGYDWDVIDPCLDYKQRHLRYIRMPLTLTAEILSLHQCNCLEERQIRAASLVDRRKLVATS